MILESIKLCNFRQFYGETPMLHFMHGEKNVTIIHGANGAGKTTLLNAFTWALYGEFSRGFQLPDELVNKRAIREAGVGHVVTAFVEVAFAYSGKKYFLRKVTEVERTAADKGWQRKGREAVSMQCRDVDGQTRTIDNVADTIGLMLPRDLYKYFFFDGERIERLVQPDPQEKRDIASATKKLLGIEVLVRGERHLLAAKKELERELRAIGDAETVGLLDAKKGLEDRVDSVNKTLELMYKNIEGASAEKKMLESRLREKQEVRSLQLKRESLQRDLESRRELLMRCRSDIDQEIRRSGYFVFLDRVSRKFITLFEDLRQRGELPAGIKKQFVEDLLAQNKCICGSSLHAADSPLARQCVEKWMERAGLADVEEKAIRLRGEVATFSSRLTAFWARADVCQQDVALHRREISRIEIELEQIREQLKGTSREDISELERKHEQADETIQEANRQIGVHLGLKEGCLADIAELDRTISRHRAMESKQRVAQQRVEITADAIDRVVKVRQLFEQELRQRLQEKIRQLFRTISITPYLPEIEDDLSLSLYESAGGSPRAVAASTGESQVLSVSFIGSLIALTKEYQAKKDRLPGPDDVQFPVVMDSPFGSLDQHHRQEVASHIPNLADQVIAMVSKSQWLGPVETSLQGKIGRQYVLTYFSPREDIASETVTLNGHNYEIVKQSPNDFEYTLIQEVTDGRT